MISIIAVKPFQAGGGPQIQYQWLLNPAMVTAVEFRPEAHYSDGSLLANACAVVHLAGTDTDGWASTLTVEDADSIARLKSLESPDASNNYGL